MINNEHVVVAGYTTESGKSEGVYGLFDLSVTPKFGVSSSGATPLDRVKVAKNPGHAFELRQAINREPKRGAAGAFAKREFDHAWFSPSAKRDEGWKKVAAAREIA